MTNPPTSGPANPQEPGNIPPHGGGFPPPGQYGQAPGYPPGYGGGYGGPPPQNRNKTGLWFGIGAAIVVIAALLITGFVAPGFFLGDDDKGSTAAPTTPSVQQPSGSGQSNQPPPNAGSCQPPAQASNPTREGNPNPALEQVIKDMVDKINTCDAEGAKALLCPNSSSYNAEPVQNVVDKKVRLSIDRIAEGSSPEVATAQASNPSSGEVRGVTLGAGIFSTGPCVAAFFVN